MSDPEILVIEGRDAGQRLDAWLADRTGESRSRIQTWIAAGAVVIVPAPGKIQPSTKLRSGDKITVTPPQEIAPTKFGAEDIPLDILYEDADILVLNKAPGIVVHPAAGHFTGTLVNALMHHCGDKLASRGGTERMGIVHRLDKDTSGVMVIAKTDKAHASIGEQFSSRTTVKEYSALAWGTFRRQSGSWKGAIGRHPHHRKKMTVLEAGREAWTDFEVKEQWAKAALVRCVLHTGRTHQIRVHLSHSGHPIVGDHLYGRGRPLPDGSACDRQMLHAGLLKLKHPRTRKEIEFRAPLPDDFQKTMSLFHAP